MKHDKPNMTVQELDELCRLYLECQLSVLEEKELEYVLSQTTSSSPAIDDVKALMGMPATHQKMPFRKPAWNWRLSSRVAASIMVVIACALFYVISSKSNAPSNESGVYVSAYCHGKQLKGDDAVVSTNIAMAKADSLINYAALMEREYLIQAEKIISQTTPK